MAAVMSHAARKNRQNGIRGRCPVHTACDQRGTIVVRQNSCAGFGVWRDGADRR
jgi:hypothetical protein